MDDIIFTTSSNYLLDNVTGALALYFAMKDLNTLHYFLGIEATFHADGLHLSQQKFAMDLCHLKMEDARPTSTPMATGSKLSKFSDTPMVDTSLYRSAVGALHYLTMTRPDIQLAINHACQFQKNPTAIHWSLVKRILRSIKATISHGITLKPISSFSLVAYSNADWAGCPDDRCSTTGFCVFFGDNIIS